MKKVLKLFFFVMLLLVVGTGAVYAQDNSLQGAWKLDSVVVNEYDTSGDLLSVSSSSLDSVFYGMFREMQFGKHNDCILAWGLNTKQVTYSFEHNDLVFDMDNVHYEYSSRVYGNKMELLRIFNRGKGMQERRVSISLWYKKQ